MKYIFTEEQFAIMLALTEAKEWYLFQQEESFSDRAIIEAVVDLYRMKRVIEVGGRLVLGEPFMEIVREMELSPYIVKLNFTDAARSQHLVYVTGHKENIILERHCTSWSSTIKLWREEANYYLHDLFEGGMIPEDLVEDRVEAEDMEEMALKELPANYSEQEIMMRIQRIKAIDGKTDNMVDVFRSAVFKWIHIYEGYHDKYHIYSLEEISDLLLHVLKEVEI